MKTIVNPFPCQQLQKVQSDLFELNVSVVTKTADYQVTEDDDIINVDAGSGSVIITLPILNILSRNHKYYIKKIDSSASIVTIQGKKS